MAFGLHKKQVLSQMWPLWAIDTQTLSNAVSFYLPRPATPTMVWALSKFERFWASITKIFWSFYSVIKDSLFLSNEQEKGTDIN